MERFERQIRGIPLWLLREYLAQCGGRSADDGWLHGRGWSARLTQLDDYRIGSLHVGQVRLELLGAPEAIEQVCAVLAPRLLRAGG